MTGPMPQPFKNKKLGTYYYRKVVPESLRDTAGLFVTPPRKSLREIRIPLDTKSLAEAKLKYPDAAAQADAILAQAKRKAAGGSPNAAIRESLSAVEIERLSASYLRQLMEEDEEARVEGLDLDRPTPITEAGYEQLSENLDHVEPHYRAALARGDWKAVAEEVDELLDQNEIALNKGSDAYKRLSLAVLKTTVAAHQLMLKRQAGEVVDTPAEPSRNLPAGRSGPVPVNDLFEAWAKERRPAPKTKDMWKGIIGKLMDHIGHDDAARVADLDVIAWKDALVASGLAPKTITNNLTVAKTFFRWAYRNKRIASDPAATVEYKAKRKPGERKQSYSDVDAKRILLTARKETDPVKRWAPWLCAFSGARIDEICGAMVADVRREAKIGYLRIDPANRENGASVKNEASIRSVPLHPIVIAEGFLKYVRTLSADGPLFPGIKPDRYGKRGGNGQRTVARWIRDKVGITSKRISPNHSWRHRFADECRKVGVPREIRFAIDGHADSSVGGKYGDQGFPLSVLAEAIVKIKSPL